MKLIVKKNLQSILITDPNRTIVWHKRLHNQHLSLSIKHLIRVSAPGCTIHRCSWLDHSRSQHSTTWPNLYSSIFSHCWTSSDFTLNSYCTSLWGNPTSNHLENMPIVRKTPLSASQPHHNSSVPQALLLCELQHFYQYDHFCLKDETFLCINYHWDVGSGWVINIQG